MIFIDVDRIRNASVDLRRELNTKGVVFINNSFKLWCNYVAQKIQSFTPTVSLLDYNISAENCELHHVNEESIYRKAGESITFSRLLGIRTSFNELNTMVFQKLTMVFYGIAAKLFVALERKIDMTGLAKLAFVNPDMHALTTEIKRLYCSESNTPIPMIKDFEQSISYRRNEVSVFLSSEIVTLSPKIITPNVSAKETAHR